MCNLRYIAFSIEYIWSLNDKEESADVGKEETKAKVQKGAVQNVGNVRKRKHNNEEVERTLATKQEKIVPPSMSFFDLLVYQMYFPLMYGGPIMNYNDFREQVCKCTVDKLSENDCNMTLSFTDKTSPCDMDQTKNNIVFVWFAEVSILALVSRDSTAFHVFFNDAKRQHSYQDHVIACSM